MPSSMKDTPEDDLVAGPPAEISAPFVSPQDKQENDEPFTLAELIEVMCANGCRRVPDHDTPAGYLAALVQPGAPEPEAVAIAYVLQGEAPLLLITPRGGHEQEDAAAMLGAARRVSLPGPNDSREVFGLTQDLPDLEPGKVYSIGAFANGRYIAYRNANAGGIEDDFYAGFAELPHWMVTTIHRATRCAPEERYRVAFASLADCGHGDAVRQELARKAVRLAEVLAVG